MGPVSSPISDAVRELQIQMQFPGPPHQPGYLPLLFLVSPLLTLAFFLGVQPHSWLMLRQTCSAWWGLVNVQVGPPLPFFL